MSWTFLLTAFVIVATPGTGAVYSIMSGLSRGHMAGVVAALACTLGIVPHLLAAITGLAALLHTSALAFNILKYLGVLYLIYMAWNMWRDQSALGLEENADTQAAPARQSFWRVMWTGVIINLLNPKLTIFFFAFLPQFVTPGSQNELPQMLLLSGVFMLMTFVVFALYGIFAAATRRFILQRPRVIQAVRQSFALTFLALGAKLAVTSRD